MRIKRIYLENIRSYEKEEISFPAGSTLLWGDIGSGKTTTLLAIEFALFGLQPGQKGNSILKNGKDNGKVILEFEVDEKNIIIERSLKRGKSITQDYCSIDIDGEKREIAVTELKNLVLELLEYPKEFSRKQNLLYKFTVYTPQEEMKQIVLEDPQTRINTLRHVFGIDKYKRILENTSVIISKIREEKKIKEGMTLSLDSDRSLLETKETELETKRYNVVSVEKELFLKTENRKVIEDEMEGIYKKIEERNKLQQEAEKTNLMISTKNDSINGNKRLIEQLVQQIREMSSLSFDQNRIKTLELNIHALRKEKEDLLEKILNANSKIHSFELKNKESELSKQKINQIEVCPTCLQDVSAVYKINVVNKMDSMISQNVKAIEEATLEKIQLSKKSSEIEMQINEKQKEIQDLNIVKIKLQNLDDKKSRLSELEKNNAGLEKDIVLLKQHLEILRSSAFEMNKFNNLYEAKEKELDFARKEERMAEIKVAELKKEISLFEKQIEELKERISKTEEVKKRLEYLADLEDWINKKFIPLVSNVERNVMIKLKAEFSRLFAEWFSMLVSENFAVRLDDEFTPVVEQHDYEIDYAYLSGGERTAIALAYRLALNQVINSLISKIKTKDLVILDEPTDGFSEQQLDKMRDVLQQLNVNQLIIVSHEQKIESFADHIIKIRKHNGLSRKEAQE